MIINFTYLLLCSLVTFASGQTTSTLTLDQRKANLRTVAIKINEMISVLTPNGKYKFLRPGLPTGPNEIMYYPLSNYLYRWTLGNIYNPDDGGLRKLPDQIFMGDNNNIELIIAGNSAANERLVYCNEKQIFFVTPNKGATFIPFSYNFQQWMPWQRLVSSDFTWNTQANQAIINKQARRFIGSSSAFGNQFTIPIGGNIEGIKKTPFFTPITNAAVASFLSSGNAIPSYAATTIVYQEIQQLWQKIPNLKTFVPEPKTTSIPSKAWKFAIPLGDSIYLYQDPSNKDKFVMFVINTVNNQKAVYKYYVWQSFKLISSGPKL